MDSLEGIASVTWWVREATDRLPALVAAACAQDKSWAQVGAGHGISRHAAQYYGQGEAAAGC